MEPAPTKLTRNSRVDLNGAGTPIALGDQTYSVIPQRIGRLRSQLMPMFRNMDSFLPSFEGASIDSILDQGMERVHSVLIVFIPDLMPMHEFCGFSTVDAYEAGDYHEGSDHGPDLPQLRVAFETCFKVNSLDLLGHLKNVFSPELIRALIQEQVLGKMQEVRQDSQTEPSTTSSSTSGPEPESTTSTTPPQTSVESSG